MTIQVTSADYAGLKTDERQAAAGLHIETAREDALDGMAAILWQIARSVEAHLACFPWMWDELQPHMSEVAAAVIVADVFTFALSRVADGFAIESVWSG
jgi:hypothetical protein